MRKKISLIPALFICLTLCAQEAPVVDTVVTLNTEPATQNEPPVFSTVTQAGPFAQRRVPPQKITELKNSEDYWYANLEPQKPEPQKVAEPRSKGLLDQGWFRDLLWILILCSFIAVVVWYLASSNIGLFRKPSKSIAEEVEEEEISEDIFSINYEKEIRKAVEAGNYRLAVRLWYLRTLKELSAHSLIQYRHEKPNGDYVNALFGGRYYHHFFRLTRHFEYTWYGGFPLSADAYNLMQTEFERFNKELPR